MIMPIVTLDHVAGYAFDPAAFPVKNMHALGYMPPGLYSIAATVRQYERKIQREFPGLVHWTAGPPAIELITNYFGWFSISLISYLRLIRLLALMAERGWSTADLKQNRQEVTEKCVSYVKDVAPAVYQWRNKIAAHPAFIAPLPGDNLGTLELSIMAPIVFEAPYYVAGAMQLSTGGESSAMSQWSLTGLFEDLRPRLWPGFHLEPLE
jgi:hypothetical protein